MIAINIQNKRKYEVQSYKDVLYYETESKALPYYILERSYDIESEIPYGYLYTYYKINDELYTGFLTNSYKAFTKPTEQMRLDI